MMKHYNCRAWGLLILRVVIGVIFIAHGWQKIDNMAGTVGFFTSLGLPAFLAYVDAWVEFIGGIAFVLGIFTKITGYLFAIIMAVAILKLKLVGGLTGAKGYEFELLLLAASLCISFAGPGIFAIGPRLCPCCRGGKCKSSGCACHMFCGSTNCGGKNCACNMCKGGDCTCMMTSAAACGCNCKACGSNMSTCDSCEMCKNGCTKHEIQQ